MNCYDAYDMVSIEHEGYMMDIPSIPAGNRLTLHQRGVCTHPFARMRARLLVDGVVRYESEDVEWQGAGCLIAHFEGPLSPLRMGVQWVYWHIDGVWAVADWTAHAGAWPAERVVGRGVTD